MTAPTAPPTIDELMARVYRHYPIGIIPDDRRYHTCEETRRLACVHEAAAIACGKGFVPVPDNERVPIDPEVQEVVDALRAWKAFGERCKQAFPDRVVWDQSGPFFDPGYRYTVAKADYVHPSDDFHDPVICTVSVLAPVYAIHTFDQKTRPNAERRYADFPDRYHDRIDTLCALAEEMFGFSRLAEDVLLYPVPDVVPFCGNLQLGEATLRDCLLTAYRW